MKVRCSSRDALQFLRLLPQQDLDELRDNTCWQQIEIIAPVFGGEALLTEVRLLFETYLDYILKSSDRDMIEVELELDRLEVVLNLGGKLPAVYRPIVEKMAEDKGEVENILQDLREIRGAEEQNRQRNRARKPKRRNECCETAAHT